VQVYWAIQMVGHSPDDCIKRALMRALEKGEQYEMMFDLFKDMQKSGGTMDPEILNTVLRARDQIRRYEQLLMSQSSFARGTMYEDPRTQSILIKQLQDMRLNRRDGGF